MDKFSNIRGYRKSVLPNNYFVICSSRSKSNNINTYSFTTLLCNYDVLEENPYKETLTYDVKL